jgi:hypothetical protein
MNADARLVHLRRAGVSVVALEQAGIQLIAPHPESSYLITVTAE